LTLAASELLITVIVELGAAELFITLATLFAELFCVIVLDLNALLGTESLLLFSLVAVSLLARSLVAALEEEPVSIAPPPQAVSKNIFMNSADTRNLDIVISQAIVLFKKSKRTNVSLN
jgi:hypothetical protein